MTCQEANAGIQKRENSSLDRKQWELWENLAIYYSSTLTCTSMLSMTITVSTNSQYISNENCIWADYAMPSCISYKFCSLKWEIRKILFANGKSFLYETPKHLKRKSCHFRFRKLLLPSCTYPDCLEHKGGSLATSLLLAWLKHSRSGPLAGNSGPLCWLNQRANEKPDSSAPYN